MKLPPITPMPCPIQTIPTRVSRKAMARRAGRMQVSRKSSVLSSTVRGSRSGGCKPP